MDKTILISAIHDYENGGLENCDFLKKAHSIYSTYATFPCELPDAENKYLLGIVYSHFAKYYQNNRDYQDYYISILESALFCFVRVLENTDKANSEHQCAAIRMLLLIDDNELAMKNIAHNFLEKKCQQLYGSSLLEQKMLAQLIAPWSYEMDILKNLGSYCIEESSLDGKHSFVSVSDMKRFSEIKKSCKYFIEWPLVKVPSERVFELFSEFATEYVEDPVSRRFTAF